MRLTVFMRYCCVVVLSVSSFVYAKNYESYSLFQKDLGDAFSKAQSHIMVSTLSFTDGGLATFLYMARLRGVSVTVLLDTQKSTHYLSRFSYFLDVQIPVKIGKLALTKEPTTILIDEQVWQVNQPLENTSYEAILVEPSRWTKTEFVEFVSGFTQTLKRMPRAKILPPSSSQNSDRIKKGNGKDLRSLPSQTRGELLLQGKGPKDTLEIPLQEINSGLEADIEDE